MIERLFNALEILTLAGILFAALALQLFFGEEPCPLCYLQRLFMIGVGIGLVLNLRLGVCKRHYGLAILSALLGGAISLRQMALHICPGYPEFGVPFWGVSLYTWAFFIFVLSVALNALLMTIFKREEHKKMHFFDHLVCWALLTACGANVIISFLHCGWGPCKDVAL